MDQWKSIQDLRDDVVSKKQTATQLVERALEYAHKDSTDSLLEILDDYARERAKDIDQQVEKGTFSGKLAGVPFVAKDNFLTFAGKTRAASNILANFEAPYQSTAISKLEAEGAILIAKANMDAFAHGSSTENSDFKITKNPHDESRVPGGSSGGPAASVAAGIVPFALGTDTGGSIRQPASYSGVFGHKPTYGLVSRYGVIAMASSTDTIGPLTNSVEDGALVLDIIAGKDSSDSTTIDRSAKSYTQFETKPLKVGVIKQHLAEGVDEAVKQSVQEAVDALKVVGAEITEVDLPINDAVLACYYTIVPAEISSNLSRYDGIRFGHSNQQASDLDAVYRSSRSVGFGKEAKRRIMIGNYVLSSGYYDAYYKKAQQVRTLIIEQYNTAFKDVDVLVGPVAPAPAFKIGENEDPLAMYLVDIMTVGPSLAGLPAASVPIKAVNGLPVGLHVIGAQRNDAVVLSVAKQVEQGVSE
ncbi:TPA: Asp-tRNA(Asn)/Glu-tRNA(Gln) amidotransferase subunit GatA [Candidatus Saccharibacteria bacterium]|nr:Asp-tRNA(Asn)/Glu-tRNA(Gln) amidotransferase subunit GatA [Candidatus Saccharibacteria bacterium]HIO87447.1 Asp-tRNA(Asn)/Glu-tRNA(Gln) amidotransferase subunit GatA [Candidatus Saccharibacteria bacterium]